MVHSLTRYSSNQDISRARQAFFAGNKSFLLVSERFHFFRRFAFTHKIPSHVFSHIRSTSSSCFAGTKSVGFVTSFSTVHQTTPNSSPSSSRSLSSTTVLKLRTSVVVSCTPSTISSRWRGSSGPKRLLPWSRPSENISLWWYVIWLSDPRQNEYPNATKGTSGPEWRSKPWLMKPY